MLEYFTDFLLSFPDMLIRVGAIVRPLVKLQPASFYARSHGYNIVSEQMRNYETCRYVTYGCKAPSLI